MSTRIELPTASLPEGARLQVYADNTSWLEWEGAEGVPLRSGSMPSGAARTAPTTRTAIRPPEECPIRCAAGPVPGSGRSATATTRRRTTSDHRHQRSRVRPTSRLPGISAPSLGAPGRGILARMAELHGRSWRLDSCPGCDGRNRIMLPRFLGCRANRNQAAPDGALLLTTLVWECDVCGTATN